MLIRLSAIGDNVFATSLIQPLKDRYPDAKLYWLTQKESVGLIKNNPHIEEVIEFPKKRFRKLSKTNQWGRFLGEWNQFKNQLKDYEFDLAIDMQGLLKSGWVAKASGAKYRVGLGSKEGSQYLMHQVVPRRLDDMDINAEYRDLALALGLKVGNFPMQLLFSPEQQKTTESFLALNGLQDGFIAAIPFTTRPQKHWFEDYWSTLIPQLHEKTGKRVLILGGPKDDASAKRIIGPISNTESYMDLTGEHCLSIADAASLIGHADLSIGMDTGMTHMSIAQQRPTIALFGSTVPYLNTRTPRTQVIYRKMDCSPCRRHPTCNGAFTCLRSITPAEVLETAIKLLA